MLQRTHSMTSLMETKEFDAHDEIAEFFEDNPKETNWIILNCYKRVLSDEDEDEVHPFSFEEGGEEFFVEVSKSDSSTGLARLMDKAVAEEHYEVAQEVKELAEEKDIELSEGAISMQVVEER